MKKSKLLVMSAVLCTSLLVGGFSSTVFASNDTINTNNGIINNGIINIINNGTINKGNTTTNNVTNQANKSNTDTSSKYLISARDGTQIDLDSYTDYIKDYKDKVKILIGIINPTNITVKISDDKSYICIFLNKDSSINSEYIQNPCIGLTFFTDEKIGISFLNSANLETNDFKNIIAGIKNYLPKDDVLPFLINFIASSKAFQSMYKIYDYELKEAMVNKSSVQLYNKNFMSSYGGYNVLFQVQNGKQQCIFNTIMLNR